MVRTIDVRPGVSRYSEQTRGSTDKPRSTAVSVPRNAVEFVSQSQIESQTWPQSHVVLNEQTEFPLAPCSLPRFTREENGIRSERRVEGLPYGGNGSGQIG